MCKTWNPEGEDSKRFVATRTCCLPFLFWRVLRLFALRQTQLEFQLLLQYSSEQRWADLLTSQMAALPVDPAVFLRPMQASQPPDTVDMYLKPSE